MTGWRPTLGIGLAAALGAATLLVVSLLGARTPFGPGELDLLLGARALASGVALPLWAGSVHPDAVGTWMGALAVSGLLRLGVPDLLALKAMATAHYALLAFCGAGLTARIAGARGGAAAGLAVALGAPAVASAHTRYLATTVEVASIELALLWLVIEWVHRPRRWLLPVLGLGLGLAIAFSLHAVVLAGLAVVAVAVRQRRVSAVIALLAPLLLASLPWMVMPEPLGPPGQPFTIKTLGPLQLLALVGTDDVAGLLRAAPRALLGGHESDAAARLSPFHLPLALALGLSLLGATVATARRQVPASIALPTLFTLGVTAPLVLAGDLLGYPAAYRYYVPGIVGAAVLLGIAVGRARAPGRALGVVLLLSLPGALTVGTLANTELTRPEAAFFAGQHRLVFPRDALHTHALMLTPWVRDDELAGWLQGYGMHVGREFARQVPTARVEYSDGFLGVDGGVPQVINRFWHKQQAARWLDGAAWLGTDADRSFLIGVGLGIGEDGRLEELDLQLLAAPAERAVHIARGIGAALGERVWHQGDRTPLQIDGDRRWTPAERQALADGFQETAGAQAPPLFADVTPGSTRVLVHSHPFMYADVGVSGRGWTPSGPR